MSTITTLTLANGESTPVNVTFDVHSGQQGTKYPATWFARLGNFKSWKELTMLVSRKSTSSRVTVKLRDPNVTADGVEHQSMVTINAIISDDADAGNRADLLAFTKEFVNSDAFADAMKDSAPAY